MSPRHPDANDTIVDFRRTILRHHVPAVLCDTRNVLAVDSILKGAPGRTSLADRDWLMDQFFLGDEPQARTWFPLTLRPPGSSKGANRGTLTDLLVRLRQRSSRGVMLTARTGAGKTLAAFKAFRDCFLPVRAQAWSCATSPRRLPAAMASRHRVRPGHNEIAAKRLTPVEARYQLLRQVILLASRLLPEGGLTGGRPLGSTTGSLTPR